MDNENTTYATVEDVEARAGRTFSASEAERCQVLLEDAAVRIDACRATAKADAKRVVSCRMVLRCMGDGDGMAGPMGATQGSMTAGPYTQSWTIGSGGGNGELYLGREDRALLGAGNAIGSYSPTEELVPHD